MGHPLIWSGGMFTNGSVLRWFTVRSPRETSHGEMEGEWDNPNSPFSHADWRYLNWAGIFVDRSVNDFKFDDGSRDFGRLRAADGQSRFACSKQTYDGQENLSSWVRNFYLASIHPTNVNVRETALPYQRIPREWADLKRSATSQLNATMLLG